MLTGLVAAAPPTSAAGSPTTITTVAGGPGRGLAGQVFQEPDAVAVGPGGVVYVADGSVVREFASAKTWEGIAAGTGVPGSSGVKGLATSARLDNPAGVAVDAAGNLIIADTGNNRVRAVAATSGTF